MSISWDAVMITSCVLVWFSVVATGLNALLIQNRLMGVGLRVQPRTNT